MPFTQMFEQVPQKPLFLTDPTGKPQIRDYQHMLSLMNHNLTQTIVNICQDINNRIFDRSKPISAIEKAFRKEDEIHHLCDQAKSRLSHEARNRVTIIE